MIKKIQYRWNRVVRKWQIIWKQALCPHDKTHYVRQDENFVYNHCDECTKTLVTRKFY